MGGCVPTGSHLLDMFCFIIQEDRHYYDSECVKRAQSTKILAIDASYKVPKWMMKWGGGRIYDALHSGTNEYNEIVMQRLSTSDNHEELGANSKALKDLDLNPYLCFSDDPDRDESLLKKNYTNLNNGSKYEIEQEEVPPELVELTTEKRILYCHTLDKVLRTISKFREDIEVHINDVSNGDDVKICCDTGMLFLLS